VLLSSTQDCSDDWVKDTHVCFHIRQQPQGLGRSGPFSCRPVRSRMRDTVSVTPGNPAGVTPLHHQHLASFRKDSVCLFRHIGGNGWHCTLFVVTGIRFLTGRLELFHFGWTDRWHAITGGNRLLHDSSEGFFVSGPNGKSADESDSGCARRSTQRYDCLPQQWPGRHLI
jgi:hypothetical protein